jgi:glutathione S-transferase
MIMTDELVFYTNPMSRGRIVRWMLEEVGVPYLTEILAYGPEMKSEAYLATNPMGKVPAIRHGDAVVTEAAAICAYLADAFPAAGLVPPPGRDRGAYYRWLFFGAGPVEAMTTNRSFGFEVPREKQGFVGYGCRDDVMRALIHAVGQSDYLAGDKFSAVDVYLGSQIGWGMRFGGIEKHPELERYSERIQSRPAAKRAREIDDALMPAAPAAE